MPFWRCCCYRALRYPLPRGLHVLGPGRERDIVSAYTRVYIFKSGTMARRGREKEKKWTGYHCERTTRLFDRRTNGICCRGQRNLISRAIPKFWSYIVKSRTVTWMKWHIKKSIDTSSGPAPYCVALLVLVLGRLPFRACKAAARDTSRRERRMRAPRPRSKADLRESWLHTRSRSRFGSILRVDSIRELIRQSDDLDLDTTFSINTALMIGRARICSIVSCKLFGEAFELFPKQNKTLFYFQLSSKWKLALGEYLIRYLEDIVIY